MAWEKDKDIDSLGGGIEVDHSFLASVATKIPWAQIEVNEGKGSEQSFQIPWNKKGTMRCPQEGRWKYSIRGVNRD